MTQRFRGLFAFLYPLKISSFIIIGLVTNCCLAEIKKDPTTELECDIAAKALEITSRLRELPQIEEVPCKVMSKAQVLEYLTMTLDKKITPERIKHEESILKTLGLIPNKYKYREEILTLYKNEIGGYYDPDENYYGLAKWLPSSSQMSVAVHELTHALQDQNFDLGAIIDPKLTTDESLAHSSLVEGDASIVMLEYLSKDRENAFSEVDVSGFILSTVASTAFNPSLTGTPKTIKSMLIFPYTNGLRFAFELKKAGGIPLLNNAFRRLPKTTREILNPSSYIEGFDYKKTTPSCREIAKSQNANEIFSDRMGEFTLRNILHFDKRFSKEQTKEESRAIWVDDQICILEKSAVSYVHWVVSLEDEKWATELEEALKDQLKERIIKIKKEETTLEISLSLL